MNFNSIQYVVFLPIVFLIYWGIPHKYRWIVLLVSSYYFYMSWNVKYVFLIFFTTACTYVCARLIEKSDDLKKQKLILVLTLVICLGVLTVFKYLHFMFDTINKVLSAFTVELKPLTVQLLLPVGISFYTFQTLSYVIDVYRGKIKAETHFGIYATFISFFPQLVAGPIERSENLLPQIRNEKQFDYELARKGMLLIAWGFFKKVVIADTLAIYANKIFNHLSSYSGLSLIIATIFFTIQIYCDFSGYSDIAIGSARLFGIRLMENFKSPYFSKSIKEFWGRWHISLSTWFRDYVYIPLGGNRVRKPRHAINLLITFLVSGLWHGANWTFVAWGGIHGIAQVVESWLPKRKRNQTIIGRAISVFLTFCFVSFAWIFFRAQNFTDVKYILTHMFVGITNPVQYLYKGYRDIYMQISLIVRCIIMLLLLAIHDCLDMKYDLQMLLLKIPTAVRWGGYLLFMWMLIAFMPIGAEQEFIYFQF